MSQARTTTVRLTPETRDRLRDAARAEGKNPDSLVRELLDSHQRRLEIDAQERNQRIAAAYQQSCAVVGSFGGSGAASVREDRQR
jgi:predicted DNA-binding protein